MIRYALACDDGHEFESWFPSAVSYDEQAARGLVSCPACGSARVEKRPMAPALASGRSEPAPARTSDGATPAVAEPPQPLAILSEREQALRSMLRAVREHVTRTADYVGPGFAEQARRMHYGEAEHRSIYGEANSGEVRALLEEGVDIHALPTLPDDRN
ncbi:DUF1178 family protein [uncultured Enterovirga sp.]|uniref:DUF1178 family protein n=1 Tax=uncultured Enterovirga sp. TaxID=2026352 RepID=UPI0035CA74B3